MFVVNTESFGDLAVVECDGRLVRSDAAYQLREAVISHSQARVIVLDMSEVTAVQGGGLGMLVYLQHWALDHNIRLKLFNPSRAVRDKLEYASMRPFEIASLDDMTVFLANADTHYALAS